MKKTGEGKRRLFGVLGIGDSFLADTAVLRGRKEAVVYGCRRILAYSPARICLSLPKDAFTVFGRGILCTAFSMGTVTLKGEIAGMCFCDSASCADCPHIANAQTQVEEVTV